MSELAFPKNRNANLVVQELGKEILIYDTETQKAFCLNETSNAVWQMCDGTRSAGDISRELGEKLKTAVPEDMIWLAIEQLKKDNLLENGDDVKIKFTKVSRREAIKKVGLASVIALPLVSSLIAPAAASAQSPGACTSSGGACTTDINGLNNCCSSSCEGGTCI